MTPAAFLELVEAKVLEIVAEPAAALGVSTQALGLRPGKRVRPRLIHSCAEALGLPAEAAVSWAALVELVHVASLIHDDVIDKAQLRRGQASLRSSLGNRRAVLGGDLIICAAWLAASRELRPDLTAVLAQAMIAMTSAEWHERDLQWNADVSLSAYFRVIEGKTAALFAAAAEGTALIAGATPQTRRALTRYGRAFGVTFQIDDDVGDFERSGKASGKEPMKDLMEGIVTLPLMIALRSGGPAAESVRRYLRSRGRMRLEPQALEELFSESRALARSRQIATRHLRQGLAGLSGLVTLHGFRQLLPLSDTSSASRSDCSPAASLRRRVCGASAAPGSAASRVTGRTPVPAP